jgi:hypothetical protein
MSVCSKIACAEANSCSLEEILTITHSFQWHKNLIKLIQVFNYLKNTNEF